MHLADEVFDHLFGSVKISNHAFAHRADGLNRTGRSAQHQFGIFPNCQHFFHAIFDVIGHHRGFRKDDPAPFDIDQRVCSAEINRHVRREQPAQVTKDIHVCRPKYNFRRPAILVQAGRGSL